MGPRLWLGLVAVEDLLHQLLHREARAAVPVTAGPLDAVNWGTEAEGSQRPRGQGGAAGRGALGRREGEGQAALVDPHAPREPLLSSSLPPSPPCGSQPGHRLEVCFCFLKAQVHQGGARGPGVEKNE